MKASYRSRFKLKMISKQISFAVRKKITMFSSYKNIIAKSSIRIDIRGFFKKKDSLI